jgi:hypothetical protein
MISNESNDWWGIPIPDHVSTFTDHLRFNAWHTANDLPCTALELSSQAWPPGGSPRNEPEAISTLQRTKNQWVMTNLKTAKWGGLTTKTEQQHLYIRGVTFGAWTQFKLNERETMGLDCGNPKGSSRDYLQHCFVGILKLLSQCSQTVQPTSRSQKARCWCLFFPPLTPKCEAMTP